MNPEEEVDDEAPNHGITEDLPEHEGKVIEARRFESFKADIVLDQAGRRRFTEQEVDWHIQNRLDEEMIRLKKIEQEKIAGE